MLALFKDNEEFAELLAELTWTGKHWVGTQTAVARVTGLSRSTLEQGLWLAERRPAKRPKLLEWLAAQEISPAGISAIRRGFETGRVKDEHIAVLIEYAAVGSKSKPKEALRWNGLIKGVGLRHVIDMISGRTAKPRQTLLPCVVEAAEAIKARVDSNAAIGERCHDVNAGRGRDDEKLAVPKVHDARNEYLTDYKAWHWQQVSGVKNWHEKANWEFQRSVGTVNSAWLSSTKDWDPGVVEPGKYVEQMENAASDYAAYCKRYGLPYQPTFMPHRISTGRADRVIEKAKADAEKNQGILF